MERRHSMSWNDFVSLGVKNAMGLGQIALDPL